MYLYSLRQEPSRTPSLIIYAYDENTWNGVLKEHHEGTKTVQHLRHLRLATLRRASTFVLLCIICRMYTTGICRTVVLYAAGIYEYFRTYVIQLRVLYGSCTWYCGVCYCYCIRISTLEVPGTANCKPSWWPLPLAWRPFFSLRWKAELSNCTLNCSHNLAKDPRTRTRGKKSLGSYTRSST